MHIMIYDSDNFSETPTNNTLLFSSLLGDSNANYNIKALCNSVTRTFHANNRLFYTLCIFVMQFLWWCMQRAQLKRAQAQQIKTKECIYCKCMLHLITPPHHDIKRVSAQ